MNPSFVEQLKKCLAEKHERSPSIKSIDSGYSGDATLTSNGPESSPRFSRRPNGACVQQNRPPPPPKPRNVCSTPPTPLPRNSVITSSKNTPKCSTPTTGKKMNLGQVLDFAYILSKMKSKVKNMTPEAIWYDDSDDEDSVDGPCTRRDSNVSNLSLDEYQKNEAKIYYICHELMTTEEAYVKRLSLLVTAKQETARILSPEIARDIFKDIEAIHRFHDSFMLPSLQKRMERWEGYRKVGDIMKTFMPFLKEYTMYVKGFHNALTLVDSWEAKSPEFAGLLQAMQQSRIGGMLKLQAHMMEPVQRVPRYKLLLQDYLKRLPENAADKKDTQESLNLVEEAARHFEQALKQDANFAQLVHLQEEIESPMNLVDFNREYILQGPLMKISKHDGRPIERYAFLFNDMVLICAENIIVVGKKYSVRQVLPIQDIMQVIDTSNSSNLQSFTVKTKKVSVELCTQSVADKKKWTQKLQELIDKCENNKSYLIRKASAHIKDSKLAMKAELGRVAPIFVNMAKVDRCSMCAVGFNFLTRKYHCHACGKVFCAVCTPQHCIMPYNPETALRVCCACLAILNGEEQHTDVFRLQPRGRCVYKGFLHVSEDLGKTWCRKWVGLCDSGILYFFHTFMGQFPCSYVLLETYQVEVSHLPEIKFKLTLRLSSQQSCTYYLYAEEDAYLTYWFDMLKKTISKIKR